MSEIVENQEHEVPTIADKLLNAAREMGFVETQQLRDIRSKLLPNQSHEELVLITSEWQDAARKMVEEGKGGTFYKKQIGLLIASAALYSKIGMNESSYEEINDAIDYASNMGEASIVDQLKSILSEREESV